MSSYVCLTRSSTREDQLYIVRAICRTLALALVFSAAILAHECGHYVYVRANGIPVEELCLGEGPVLLEGHLPDGALLRLRAIPFSGFVQPDHTYIMMNPPSREAFIGMFSAGIFSTTALSCVLFMLFATLSGLKPGIWRPLWFGFRRTFVALLSFPFQMVYGVITFQSHRMILTSWPVRMLVPFLLDMDLEHEEGEQRLIVQHGWIQWLGMFAVAVFACSLLGIIPLGMTSDPSMIIRLGFTFFPWLPFDATATIVVLEVALVTIIFLFLIQLLLLMFAVMLRDWLEKRRNQEK